MEKHIKENELLDSVELRQRFIGRIDILDKVKVNPIGLLPNEIATTIQVADFYNVPKKMVQNIVSKFKGELQTDGYTVKTGNEITEDIASSNVKVLDLGRQLSVEWNNIRTIMPKSSIGVFSRKGILRVGMLLEESTVAKKVREIIVEDFNSQETVKTLDVNQKGIGFLEEDYMLLNVIHSFDKSKEELCVALGEYRQFKNNQNNDVKNELHNLEKQFEDIVKSLGKIIETNIPSQQLYLNT